MKARKLGATGPEVSTLGLGCMSFAGFSGPTDEKTSLACLDAAWDAGIDFLDTADVYGMGLSETIIGKHMATRGRAFHIATKGGIRRAPEKLVDNGAAYLRSCLEGSLRRLGVEYVPLYYIHRREQDVPVEDTVEVLAQFVKEGKIGGYGLSEVSPTTLRRAHAVYPCMAVQSEYSLWTRSPEMGLIQECARLGVAFVPFSPLGRGILVDQPVQLADIPEGTFRSHVPRFQEPHYSKNVEIINKLQIFARDRGWTTSAVALAWILDQSDHLIPIPATRYAEHLQDWLAAVQIEFTDADRAEIDRILPIGWAWGDRYSTQQWAAPEKYS